VPSSIHYIFGTCAFSSIDFCCFFFPIASLSWSFVWLSWSRLYTLIKSGCLGHTPFESSFYCKSCHIGKQIQLPYYTSDSHSARPFDLVHSSAWGLTPFVSKGCNKYYVIFVDDHSCYIWIYFIKRQSELLPIYKSFARMVHTQFFALIKIFDMILVVNIYLILFDNYWHQRVR
jgi:hypothetical protein